MNYFVIFLTGLTTGGLSCLAMQGGLLAGIIANQKEQEFDEVLSDKAKRKALKRESYLRSVAGRPGSAAANLLAQSFDQLDWLPVTMFLAAKLIIHILFGFLLGWLGSMISLSLGVRLAFQIFAALFMFATAMNLLQVHPIFRFLAFQPPRFLRRAIYSTSKSRALFAPVILGLFTIFIPCGVTQAMEVLAINSGSPLQGALIMGSFILGTTPLFAVLGVATAKLSELWQQKFMKVAATALIVMAIYSINGVLLVMDSPLTLNRLLRPVTYFFSDERFSRTNQAETVDSVDGVQKVTINVLGNGYSPKYIKVKAGEPVELTLKTADVYSCATSFIFRQFGINARLKPTDQQTFTFTPQQKGRFTFSCSMGMYSGVMEVI